TTSSGQLRPPRPTWASDSMWPARMSATWVAMPTGGGWLMTSTRSTSTAAAANWPSTVSIWGGTVPLGSPIWWADAARCSWSRTAWVTGSVTAAVHAREMGAIVWRVSLMRPRFPFDVGSGVLSLRVWFTRRSFDHDWEALRLIPGALVVSSGAVSGLVAGLGL